MECTITQYGQLSEAQKIETVEIFIEGFKHLMKFTNDREVLKALFLPSFNPLYTYVLLEREQVRGILGIGTNKIRPIKFEKDICKELFGNFKGSILCSQMNAIFQSKAVKEDTDLYIDMLAIAEEARGKGVATTLLQYSFDLKGYKNYYIEVMSKNTNAKRLYEKVGFKEYKRAIFSPLALSGYGYPIKMKKV